MRASERQRVSGRQFAEKSRKKRLRQIGETFTEVQDDKANPELIALLNKFDWSALCETYSL